MFFYTHTHTHILKQIFILLFLDGELVEFRYYNGINNRLLAKSSSLKFTRYKNENELITCCITGKLFANNMKIFLKFLNLKEIKATQLRKGMFFNPDPYVKIFVQTNNGQNNNSSREYKTSVMTNTCFPSWKNDVIMIFY